MPKIPEYSKLNCLKEDLSKEYLNFFLDFFLETLKIMLLKLAQLAFS